VCLGDGLKLTLNLQLKKTRLYDLFDHVYTKGTVVMTTRIDITSFLSGRDAREGAKGYL
jgi:hypothetical protein